MVVVSLDRKQSLQQAQRNSVTKDPEEGGEGGFVYFSIKNVTKLICTPPNLHKGELATFFLLEQKPKPKNCNKNKPSSPTAGGERRGEGRTLVSRAYRALCRRGACMLFWPNLVPRSLCALIAHALEVSGYEIVLAQA